MFFLGSQFEGVKSRLLRAQRTIASDVKNHFGGSYERFVSFISNIRCRYYDAKEINLTPVYLKPIAVPHNPNF